MASVVPTSISQSPLPFPLPFPFHTKKIMIIRKQNHHHHHMIHNTRIQFQFQPKLRFAPLLLPHASSSFLESGGGGGGGADVSVKDLFETIFYTVADAAAAASSSSSVPQNNNTQDWFSGISNYMETVLKFMKVGLSGLNVPYSYGFAIILLTLLVKAATFPLTKKQVESGMAMRSLQPQIKSIQERFAGNQERIQLETARLYKLAKINPLAGCLPTLATIPIWIGLYRALSNVADEGLLTEGFFWIPSLAGPTTVAARQTGTGISWLFPFIDGHPPLGWQDTFAYLVLPVLLVVSQYISVQIMQSSQNVPSNDPNMKTSQAITKFLPLMIGYFALSVPSGLSLYWLTNNILSTAQQVWLQKLGGAEKTVMQFTDDIIEEEEPNVPNTNLLANTQIETSEPQEKKMTLDGPRPGDRFKQLKEEEARKKQKMEEEKRKIEEAAASGSEIINEGHNKSSTTNGTLINGNYLSKVDGKDDQLSYEEEEKESN